MHLEATVNNLITGTDIAKIINTYESAEAEIVLKAKKIFEGGTLQGEDFTFQVKEGNVLIGSATNDADGNIVFPTISYNKVGQHIYTITEVSENLPGVKYDSNSYTVTVTVTDNNGTLTATADSDYLTNGIEFKNEYTLVNISGSKTWADNNNQDGIRPKSITICLLADGTEVASQSVTAESNWTYSFTNLPKYENGTEIVYTITEDPVEGYEASIDGYNVTNTHTPETTQATVVKVWDDHNNQDGVRPDSLTVTLSSGQTVILNEENDWTVTVTDLPKYQDGKEIVYTWTESTLPDGYELKNSSVEGTITTLTNTYIPKKIAVSGSKTWDDQENLAQGRPDSITINLLANGVIVDSQKVDEQSGWSWSFENLDQYKDGTEIEYSITEEAVPGYTDEIKGYSVTNTYEPKPAKATVEVKKELTGRKWHKNDAFEFVISAADEVTKQAVEDGKVTLPKQYVSATSVAPLQIFDIIFHAAGKYSFIIRETKGDADGITYTDKTLKLEYRVYDSDKDPDGELDAVLLTSVKKEDLIFTNDYTVTPVEPIGITATKRVTAAEGLAYTLEEGDFYFKLTPSAANPKSDPIKEQTVTNDADGNVVFATDGEYTEAGTYQYEISELGGEKGGIVYDESQYTITVEVTDLDSAGVPIGKLTAAMTIAKGEEAAEDIVFENEYLATETDLLISGHKVLKSDHKSLQDQEFTFEIRAVGANKDSAPMPESTVVANDGSGNFQFGSIRYTQPGTYTYEISEVKEDKAGYSYDDTVHTVTVTVTDKDEFGQETGVLKATATGILDDQMQQLIVFENTYVPRAAEQTFGGKKTLEGRAQRAGEFEFELRNSENTVIQTAKNNADGSFAFAPVSFDKAGTYTFTITEKDTRLPGVLYDKDTIYYVDVKVTDEGYDGQLDVESVTYSKGFDKVDPSQVTFKNTYKAVSANVKIEAFKELSGRLLEAGEFCFILEDAAGNRKYALNDAEGRISFEKLNFSNAGTYEYTLYEDAGSLENIVYDRTVFRFTVTVEDDLNGQLIAKVSQDLSKIVFTNRYEKSSEPDTTPDENNPPVQPSEPDKAPINGSPNTGDDSAIGIWLASAAASLAALLGILFRRRSKR